MHKYVVVSAAQTVGLTSNAFSEAEELAEEMLIDAPSAGSVGIYELKAIGTIPPPVKVKWQTNGGVSSKTPKKRPAKAYKDWTPNDEKKLMWMYADGHSVEDIANALNRTVSGIRNRVERLHLHVNKKVTGQQ